MKTFAGQNDMDISRTNELIDIQSILMDDNGLNRIGESLHAPKGDTSDRPIVVRRGAESSRTALAVLAYLLRKEWYRIEADRVFSLPDGRRIEQFTVSVRQSDGEPLEENYFFDVTEAYDSVKTTT